MGRRTLTVLLWAIATATLLVAWRPVSWTWSGDRLSFEFDFVPSVALIAITIAAVVLVRRFGKTQAARSSARTGPPGSDDHGSERS